MHAPASALLQASGLPTAWAGRAAWTILDTAFGNGERFLATWQTWQADARRPTMLHYVGHISPEDYGKHFTLPSPNATADAQALHKAAAGRAGGVHRLLWSQGQVSLTLCIGESKALLADHRLFANTVWVEEPHLVGDKWTAKALARRCARHASLIARFPEGFPTAWLSEAGFVDLGVDPAIHALKATFNPAWSLGAHEPPPHGGHSAAAPHCCVLGAGISGASVAYAMARRGWHVTVLEKESHAAAGASGLPVGLVVPHVSADDSPRSRLSRVGARLMLQHADALLTHGTDWAMSGVHEHRFGDGPDRLHTHAGWIKPSALVKAWLAHPRITVRYGAEVQGIERGDATWSLLDGQGKQWLAADVVVLANAYGARGLLEAPSLARHRAATLPLTLGDLQAVHGTASLGVLPTEDASAFGAMPHNGHGCFIAIPASGAQTWWLAGSSFEHDAAPSAQSMRSHRLASLEDQHAGNLARLKVLLPDVAEALAGQFGGDGAQVWSGTRCVTHDRLPLAGPVDLEGRNGLWMHIGMGARGLTFSALGAELIAARMCAEPWPVEAALARAIDSQRLRKRRTVPGPKDDAP